MLAPGLVRGVASCFASGVAEAATLPIDKVKVLLQDGNSGSMLSCLGTSMAEGPGSSWAGLTPALLRQCSYSSLALILHEPALRLFAPLMAAPLMGGYLLQLWAGGLSGAIAILVFNWTEVLKTQAQLSARRGHEAPTLAAIGRRIYRTDGIGGFWAGSRPNVVRTFLVMAAELGTFNQIKALLTIRMALVDGLWTYLLASSAAALASACTSTPADVVKTRLMAQAGRDDDEKGGGERMNAAQMLRHLLKSDGLGALYKGFVPVCVRKIVWCACFFSLYESLLRLPFLAPL